MAKKVHLHHKDLKDPDPFFETIGRANRYVRENRAQVIAAAVAVTVLFVGGVSWSSLRTRAADHAAATFLRATEALDSGSTEAARTGLTTVIDEAGDPYRSLARIYRARLEIETGEYQAAIDDFTAAASSDVPDYLRQTALVGKAQVLETTERFEEAAATYQRAAAIDGPHKEQALRGQLRAATAASRPELAKEAIERLLDQFPSSPDADDLSARLAALESSSS